LQTISGENLLEFNRREGLISNHHKRNVGVLFRSCGRKVQQGRRKREVPQFYWGGGA